MKTVVETFIYQIPDDCEDYISIKEYVDFVNDMTCPFYDGCDAFVPEIDSHNIEVEGF